MKVHGVALPCGARTSLTAASCTRWQELRDDLRGSTAPDHGLAEALDSRAVVAHAQGVVMEREGKSASKAYAALLEFVGSARDDPCPPALKAWSHQLVRRVSTLRPPSSEVGDDASLTFLLPRHPAGSAPRRALGRARHADAGVGSPNRPLRRYEAPGQHLWVWMGW